jgi:hypothetical protein
VAVNLLPARDSSTASWTQWKATLDLSSFSHFAYQRECGDHRLQERHCVSAHWCRQAGHTPPVSNVFHE